MHLGRFHAVIYDLNNYFKNAKLADRLDNCANALELFNSSRDQNQLISFRTLLDEFFKSVEVKDDDLLQPYALQTISELEIGSVLPPTLNRIVQEAIASNSFDGATLAIELRKISTNIRKKTASIESIDNSFTELSVEFERLNRETEEAEIGFLIPRDATGETLKDLSQEFNKLSNLFKAINELTGAPEYDAKVRTISSSDWQIFIDLGIPQITLWIVAIERIVALFKSNLEIKKLQKELASKSVSKTITDLLEKEISEKISTSINQIATDLVQEFNKTEDSNRSHELENQLRIGLKHIAKRMNEGTKVEMNIAIPNNPNTPDTNEPDSGANSELIDQISAQREKIASLRLLRTRAASVSVQTSSIETSEQLFLSHDENKNTTEESTHQNGVTH